MPEVGRRLWAGAGGGQVKRDLMFDPRDWLVLLPEVKRAQHFMFQTEGVRPGFWVLGQASPLPWGLRRVRGFSPQAQAPVLGRGGGWLPMGVEDDHALFEVGASVFCRRLYSLMALYIKQAHAPSRNV